jgi:hypothetical protein
MKISDKAKLMHQEAIIIDGQLAFEVDMLWDFSKKWDLSEIIYLVILTNIF